MTRAANPTATQDKTDREPFTAEELRLLCTAIAQPWRDMILISFLTGGQHIGDIACLKWESVNREAKTITFITGKTRKLISHPMIKPLRDCLSRLWQKRLDEVYVFPDMARRSKLSRSGISVEFTSILKALGIATPHNQGLSGDRRNVSKKRFHSIRHTVVSLLHSGNKTTQDVARAIMRHDLIEIERAYAHKRKRGTPSKSYHDCLT